MNLRALHNADLAAREAQEISGQLDPEEALIDRLKHQAAPPAVGWVPDAGSALDRYCFSIFGVLLCALIGLATYLVAWANGYH